ncbi:MAG TPA: MqnA/MqnD/SBP family protein [Clostridia bacterium]|nr:MqnA/MqnD/SBP family protein [Clostridia bacterium]
MKKRLIIFVVILAVAIVAISGCRGGDSAPSVTVKVAALNGPTGMGMVKMMEDAKENSSYNYEFSTVGAPDELSGKVISGEFQIAALPTNMASVIYNKTEGQIQLAAINTLGVLYILEDGEDIKEIADLKDKKLNASGKGATPDYILQYLLKENGLDPERDVEIDFSMQHADLAAAVAAGDVSIALLPEPHVTSGLMKNEEIRVALDVTKEWEKVAGDENPLPMGCIVVQKEFAENNPKIMDDFLAGYEESVKWVNENPEEAGQLIEKHGILPNAKLAEKAIPKSNIVFLDGKGSKGPMDAFLKVLHDLNPASVGGKLPDEAFYYTKE